VSTSKSGMVFCGGKRQLKTVSSDDMVVSSKNVEAKLNENDGVVTASATADIVSEEKSEETDKEDSSKSDDLNSKDKPKTDDEKDD
jgi:hypothetical protein